MLSFFFVRFPVKPCGCFEKFGENFRWLNQSMTFTNSMGSTKSFGHLHRNNWCVFEEGNAVVFFLGGGVFSGEALWLFRNIFGEKFRRMNQSMTFTNSMGLAKSFGHLHRDNWCVFEGGNAVVFFEFFLQGIYAALLPKFWTIRSTSSKFVDQCKTSTCGHFDQSSPTGLIPFLLFQGDCCFLFKEKTCNCFDQYGQGNSDRMNQDTLMSSIEASQFFRQLARNNPSVSFHFRNSEGGYALCGFKKASLQNPREMIRGRIFTWMIRVSAQKSELRAKSRGYKPKVRVTAGQTPRMRTESPRKGARMAFRCFYRKPPLKPSWIQIRYAVFFSTKHVDTWAKVFELSGQSHQTHPSQNLFS